MPRNAFVLALVGALAAALVLSGCGGSSKPEAETATTAARPEPPTTVPEVGETLRSFVEAAGTGDARSMWSLLAPETQERLGPGEADFERRYGEDFQRGLGAFVGGDYRVMLSVETQSGWGIAAVAGNRVRSGEQEFAAYGAALRREGGSWKLVLGEEVGIENVAPRSQTTQERQPLIGARVRAETPIEEAGIWLDGDALPAKVRAADGRDIRIEGTPSRTLAPGWHVVVVFGRTGEIASAGARPFRVDANDDDGAGSVA